MTELTTPAPDSAATPPVESTPPPAQPARGADGKFVAKEQQQAPTAPESAATTEPKPDAEAPKTEPETREDKPRRSAGERINQLVAEKHAALREAQALRDQLQRLQSAPQRPVDPNDYDAVQRENLRNVVREEQTQQTAAQFEVAVRRAQQAQADAFAAKVEAARERIPDIDMAVQQFLQLPVSEHAGEIIGESEMAAEIAHYLAKNPGEAWAIYRMTPAQQGRALARIEQRVSVPARRTTAAPPPPPTVTGAQPPRERSPAEMSAAEYVTWRKAQWAKGQR